MSDGLYLVLAPIAVLGCGLVGGIFFAFSAFVMKALNRLPPAEGIAAMQSINVTVINPLFLTAFFGTAVACAILSIFSLLSWERPGAVFLVASGLTYLVGTILVTVLFNVPRNEALADVGPESAGGSRLWKDYVLVWTAWNHVRTVAALAAAAAPSMALRY